MEWDMKLQSPMSTIYQLPDLMNHVSFIHHMYVREDTQVLYGFFDEAERALFRTLIKTSGVGPKLALTLLSGMDSSNVLSDALNNAMSLLWCASRRWQKNSRTLLIEMAGKLDSMGEDFEFKIK